MLLQVVESPVLWQLSSFKRFETSKNLGEKGNLASVSCVGWYRESSVSNNHCCLHLDRTSLQHSRAEPQRRILCVWKPESRIPRDYQSFSLMTACCSSDPFGTERLLKCQVISIRQQKRPEVSFPDPLWIHKLPNELASLPPCLGEWKVGGRISAEHKEPLRAHTTSRNPERLGGEKKGTDCLEHTAEPIRTIYIRVHRVLCDDFSPLYLISIVCERCLLPKSFIYFWFLMTSYLSDSVPCYSTELQKGTSA